MRDAVREVEAAFRAMGEGRTEVRPRQRVRIPGGILNIMAAAWADRGYYGFKDYAVSKEGIRFWVHLFDARTGSAVAIIQADRMGQRRTGAASGVAARHLARRGAATVGLIGTGWQAETQLEALCEVRDIRRARCYSRRPSKRGVFARRMSSALGIDVRPVDSARAAVRGTHNVDTATIAKTPVLR